jgi:hypothetical protein
MRNLIYLLTALSVMGLAFWAYRENYRTQAAISQMTRLQSEISSLREGLGVLRAEWAYLNRPERLRELANLNYPRLELQPLSAQQFGAVAQVAYPAPETAFPLGLVLDPIDTLGTSQRRP